MYTLNHCQPFPKSQIWLCSCWQWGSKDDRVGRSVSQTLHYIVTDRIMSTNVGSIKVKFYGHQRVNPKDFDDSLNVHLVPPIDQVFSPVLSNSVQLKAPLCLRITSQSCWCGCRLLCDYFLPSRQTTVFSHFTKICFSQS